MSDCFSNVLAGFVLAFSQAANAFDFAILGAEFPGRGLAAEVTAAQVARAAADTVERARHALDRPPAPMATIHVEGTLPGEGIADSSWKALRDVPVALDLAIAWRLTGKRPYLAQAGRYLDAWAQVYEVSLNPIDETFMSDLILAYDLTEEALPANVRENVDGLLSRMATGYVDAMETGNVRRMTHNINWQSHRVKLATLASFQLGDEGLIARSRALFEKQIEANLKADGPPVDFIMRDALHYVVFTLEPLLEAALAARSHHQEWFTWQSSGGAHLGRSLDWLAVYARGEKTHVEYVNSRVPFDRERREAGAPGFDNAPWQPVEAAKLYALASLIDPRYAVLSKRLGGMEDARIPDWTVLVGDSTAAQVTTAPITFTGAGLITSDLERTIVFYRDGLGLALAGRFQTKDLTQAAIRFDDTPGSTMLFLMQPTDSVAGQPGDAPSPREKFVLSVPDAARVRNRLVASGYQPGNMIENATHEVRLFFAVDPDGHRIEVTERRVQSSHRVGPQR